MTWRTMITSLRASGHPLASRYPMGRVLLEYTVLQAVQKKQLASAAVVFQMAVGAMLNEEAAKAFNKYVIEA